MKITLLNEKGGVGKTTLAVTIACGLAAAGQNTLLIDTDSQGNAATALGMVMNPSLYDLLVRDVSWKKCISVVNHAKYSRSDYPGTLGFVSSNIETRAIPNLVGDEYKLATRLNQMVGFFDVVIIDTPPTPSMLHVLVVKATDGILYPSMCEALPIDGLSRSLKRFEDHGIPTIGIVPTLYRAGTLEHSTNLESMRREFGDRVWEPVHQRTAWAESTRAKKPVFAYDSRCDATAEAMTVINRVKDWIDEQAPTAVG